MGVGLLTGLVGMVFAYSDDQLLGALDLGDYEKLDAFIIGFVVGLVFCAILMSIVGAAVNTVIVCFADSPREFEANHPELSAEMREAWTKAWPELFYFE
jgi:hypothetical protein